MSESPSSGGWEPPGWLADVWENDTTKVIALVAAIYVVYILMGYIAGFDLRGQMNSLGTLTRYIALFALLSLALNLHWGYTGLFNIGVIGFMAIGIYVTAFVSKGPATTASGIGGFGLPLWVGVIAGMLAAAVFGLVVALPALRLRADYLAIVTIAFSEIVRFTFLSDVLQTFTLFGREVGFGGGRGVIMPFEPLDYVLGLLMLDGVYAEFVALFEPIIGTNPDAVVDNLMYSVLLLLFVVVYYVAMRRIGNSPFGRVLKAIREDEDATESLGKNTNVFKTKSFMLGCALMGLGGILWYIDSGSITPNTFRPRLTFFIWIALIIGGAGSNTGSVMGGAVFAAVLFQGPRYVKNVIEELIEIDAPATFGAAARPLSSLDPFPMIYYTINNITQLQLVFMGIALVWLMHNRPQGMLGHRKEEAAAVPLGRPHKPPEERSTAAADGGTETNGGADHE